jgi:hypothetical protein
MSVPDIGDRILVRLGKGTGNVRKAIVYDTKQDKNLEWRVYFIAYNTEKKGAYRGWCMLYSVHKNKGSALR